MTLTYFFPDGYTAGSSNARKAYQMMGITANHSEAQLMCKADEAWLVMPKTSDDIADILVYGGKKPQKAVSRFCDPTPPWGRVHAT